MTEVTEAKWVGRAQGVLAAVVLVAAAQFWPGWQLDSAADKDIATAYNTGYVLAQAPICATQFMAQPDAQAKLAELKDASGSFAQLKLIPEALRTLPGESSVDYALGRECLKFIKSPEEAAQL